MANELVYRFVGRVIPERADVQMLFPPFDIESRDENFQGKVSLEIIYSQIKVVFVSNSAIENLYTLKNYIEDAVRLHVDAFGYLNGCGYDIEITGLIDSEKNEKLFSVDFDSIYQNREKRKENYSKLLGLIYGTEYGRFLEISFNDLREATKKPKSTGFFCYRAIESICQYFANELNKDKTDKDSWDKLRFELSLENDFVDLIKDKADKIRHGIIVYTSGEDRVSMLKTTWDVLDKFVSYLYKQKTGEELSF